jgi:hypothetical protein
VTCETNDKTDSEIKISSGDANKNLWGKRVFHVMILSQWGMVLYLKANEAMY